MKTAWIQHLLEWYDANRRDMPWRSDPDPYRVWISEIMLQQTQVATVIPYFERFIRRFPTIAHLARANEQSVLKVWEGLGYYSRARNLRKAAVIIHNELAGALPTDYAGLKQLPGMGPYTAAAVASIAYGEAVPVVDGNVLRVFARYWGIESDIRKPATRNHLQDLLAPFIAKSDPSRFNQALMELGALICRPKVPACLSCPIRRDCVARREDRTQALPFSSPRKPIPSYEIAAAVIWRKGKVLIARRRVDQMLGGLWEFPGGKQEAGESLEQTVRREIKEELDIRIRVGEAYPPIRHAYTHLKIRLHAFDCRIQSGRPKALAADELRWVHPDEFDILPFPKADIRLFDMIRQRSDSANLPSRLVAKNSP